MMALPGDEGWAPHLCRIRPGTVKCIYFQWNLMLL